MQNILLLLARYGSFVLFILFEFICFYLIVNFNQEQRSIFLNSSKVYSGAINEKVLNYEEYFKLSDINEALASDNARLIEESFNNKKSTSSLDTISDYIIKSANIVGNTYNLRNNHFTINIGKNQGITSGLGVIGSKGLLGIIRNVSDNYSHVNSILHSQTRISCTVSPHLYPGNLIWKTSDPRYMMLEAIPKHITISKGDTIVTNGFSTIFPKGIMVGIIEDYNIDQGSNNYEIKVKLVNDIAGAETSYVVINKKYEEIHNLIEKSLDE